MLNTRHESYSCPSYILAASSENKNKKSMFFILYNRKPLRVILFKQDA